MRVPTLQTQRQRESTSTRNVGQRRANETTIQTRMTRRNIKRSQERNLKINSTDTIVVTENIIRNNSVVCNGLYQYVIDPQPLGFIST